MENWKGTMSMFKLHFAVIFLLYFVISCKGERDFSDKIRKESYNKMLIFWNLKNNPNYSCSTIASIIRGLKQSQKNFETKIYFLAAEKDSSLISRIKFSERLKGKLINSDVVGKSLRIQLPKNNDLMFYRNAHIVKKISNLRCGRTISQKYIKNLLQEIAMKS